MHKNLFKYQTFFENCGTGCPASTLISEHQSSCELHISESISNSTQLAERDV